MNNNYENIKSLISEAIELTYTLRTFMNCLIMNLGENNDHRILRKLQNKAIDTETLLESKLNQINTYMTQKRIPTKRLAQGTYSMQKTKKPKTSRLIFHLLYKQNLSNFNLFQFPKNKKGIKTKDVLINLEAKIKNKEAKSVVFFEYYRTCIEKSYAVHVELTFNFKIKLECFKGIIVKYSLGNDDCSQNICQLFAMFSNYCDLEFRTMDMHIEKCVLKAAKWIYDRKDVFLQKCYLCENHLCFLSGTPMLPLFLFNKKYYHLECYS